MKRLLMLLLVVLTFSLSSLNSPFISLSDNSSTTEISFKTPEFHLESETRSNQTIHRLEFDDGRSLEGIRETGLPQIPTFSQLIEIPELSRVEPSIEILEEEILLDIFLTPCQSLEDPNRDPLLILNNEIYSANQFYPEASISVNNPGIMRNHLVAQLQLNPIRYNPVTRELHIIKKANITLNYVSDSNGLRASSKPTSEAFEKMIASSVLNPTSTTNRDNPTPGSYLFVYGGNDAVKSVIDVLAEWKHRKGYEINFLNTEIYLNDAQQIRNQIRNMYQTMENPPEYICIVGDADGNTMVPIFFQTVSNTPLQGDFPYTLLLGDYIYPDACVGRLSFGSIFELQTMIARIIGYEQTPDLTNDWLDRTLLVGDTNPSGASTINTIEYCKSLIVDNNPNMEFEEVYSSPFPIQMMNGLNSSVGTYFYRGHGGMSGFGANDLTQLTNAYHNPIHIAITCNNGEFVGGTSYMEELMLQGTPGNPRGIVAGIGSSWITHTCYNNIITAGIAYSLYQNDFENLGTALNFGKLTLRNNYPNNPVSTLEWYDMILNLMGDPGMNVWKGTPHEATVQYPPEIDLGHNSININIVDENSNPVSEAWVTLLKDDEVFTSCYSDMFGNATLVFSAQTTGIMQLTISKPDLKPFLADIDINEPEELIKIEEISNLVGFENGSVASFNLILTNTGSSSADNVSATISCDHELITISNNYTDFGNINPGASVTSTSSFQIELAPTCSNGEEIDFNISITSDNASYQDVIRLTVSGPEVEFQSYQTANSLLPGVSTELTLTLNNIGSIPLQIADAIIRSSSQDITFSDSLATFPLINCNSSSSNQNDTFSLIVSGECLPGMAIPANITLTDNNGIIQTLDFELAIAEPSYNDPIGPDSYGYYCYDDSDTNYALAPQFDWIEISPDYGGDGNVLDLECINPEGDGDYTTIDLPFQMNFYGVGYNQLTICSNGFVMPGSKGSIEWMNWSLPGPFVPRPIIAPFWDALLINQSNVCWKYDEEEHAVIVEWPNLLNRYENASETFQLLIYDPEYSSSAMGDSSLKFQYLEINNVDQGNYGGAYVDHGQYATVGIADHNGIAGLQYTFNNSYHQSAPQLHNGMALLFNGAENQPNNSSLILADITIEDENGNQNLIVDNGETIQFYPSLLNRGLETATDIICVLTSSSEYISIINNNTSYPDIESISVGDCSTPFSFEIADNCPNNYIIDLTLILQYSDQMHELIYRMRVSAPELIYSSFLIEETATDDGCLGSDESGFIQLTFLKNSYLDIENTNISITCSNTDVELFNSSQTFASITQDTLVVGFPVFIPESINNGDSLNFNFSVSTGSNSNDFEFDFIPKHYELIFQEDFTEINAEWNTFEGVLVDENLAGGSGKEVHLLTGSSNNHLSCTLNSERRVKSLQFRFNYRQINNAYLIELVVSYGSNFIEWSNNLINDTPQQAVIEVSYDDYHEIFEPSFTFVSRQGEEGQIFALDDLEVYAFYEPKTVITGHIDLTGGTGDITETEITNTISTTNADDEGNFRLEVPTGWHTVTIRNAGYTTSTIAPSYYAPGIHGPYNSELEYLPAPTDLTFNLEEDQVDLSWSFQQENTKHMSSKNEREFNNFRVSYRINDSITFYDVTSDTTFSRTMPFETNYEVLVQACYNGGEYSLPTNTVTISVDTSSSGNAIPGVYKLAQNHPNPFNPSTTISFDLPEAASRCNLTIYNCKGQLVNTLVNEAKPAGRYNQVWNGKDENGKQVSSGLFLYKLSTDVNKTVIKKMILLK